jgi:hypothetical protein
MVFDNSGKMANCGWSGRAGSQERNFSPGAQLRNFWRKVLARWKSLTGQELRRRLTLNGLRKKARKLRAGEDGPGAQLVAFTRNCATCCAS